VDFVFISMPYARFISRWFANVPNVNLGIMQAFLTRKGLRVKTFHFHLEFLPFIARQDPKLWENFLQGSEEFGVEYMGLDYVFASLLFEGMYESSRDFFIERLESIGLTIHDFENMRGLARFFIDSAFSRVTQYVKDARLVGFSCSHYQLSSSLLLCSRIKRVRPDILTVFGGKDCTGAFGYELMKNIGCVDFTGVSECEVTVDSLIEYINGNGKKIYNVLFRNEDGVIDKSESRPNMSLNSLPFPQYDFQDFTVPADEVILPLEFGRGCPWKKCTFCPDQSYNIICQTKRPDYLKAEIEYYQSISGDLRNFFILDSDALKDKKSILELSEYLQGKNLTFHYGEFRAERMDREVLRALLKFGTWATPFQIGIETFSDRVLKMMNKGVTVLKNVEVLKAGAELGVPVQFNLFTCYPGMTTQDMLENNKVMDLVTHILVFKNIQIYPGEFYLPTDCPVFLNIKNYEIKKHTHSVLSSLFRDFPMHSYSNYPYQYQFDNDEEQFRMSEIIRNKVQEIKSRHPSENFMVYEITSDGNLKIALARDGKREIYRFNSKTKDLYLSATEEIQYIDDVSKSLNLPPQEVLEILEDLHKKGLVLSSPDKKSFLSLATKIRHNT
jgi:radical SAM superfamily enzyme YgiQ (UPF0313 family)